MRIYSNSQLSATYKNFIVKENNGLFGKLVGVNIETDAKEKVHVYPVYRHLILYQVLPGQFLIELSLGIDKSFLISFSSRGIETRIMTPQVSDVGKEIA